MDAIIKQLDLLLENHTKMVSRSKHNDLSDLSKLERQSLVTRALAAIHRISGKGSTYSFEIERILNHSPDLHAHTSSIMGIVQALRDDINEGYIKTLVEIIHADMFANFLDRSYHLSKAGHKDAAAVIAGSTLESHIKELCSKYKIETVLNNKPVHSNTLNEKLVKAGAYSKLDQKNVTAWQDLRNNAAHGNYEKYTLEQVELLIAGIRDFIGRTPS